MERVERINAAKCALLPQVLDAAGPSVHRLTDKFIQAAEFVEMADARYRKDERAHALGLTRADATRAAADRYNDAALELLTEDVPDAIKAVREEFGDKEIDARKPLALFEQEIRERIATTDISGAEAEAAGRMLTETIEVANQSGIGGLCDRLDQQVAELAELRRRRPEHNDPVRLVVGLIVIGIGAIIIGVCWAVTLGGCRSNTVLGVAYLVFLLGITIIVSSAEEREPR
jgi:hypothetical protein